MTAVALPVTTTIAGSDSGGGAGIQADLKTFSHLNTFGTSVLTCVTAQNPTEVTGIQEISTELLLSQIKAVFEWFPVASCKTGMLFSTELIKTLGEYWKEQPPANLVVDPVMVATSGARLLQFDAIEALKEHILPHATIVTPNLPEAEILLGKKISLWEDSLKAVEELYQWYSVPFLLKGGHLPQERKSVDVFYDGSRLIEIKTDWLDEVNTHGTGCTLSAAIVAYLASGSELVESIQMAKQYLQQTFLNPVQINEQSFLNHTPTSV